MCFGITYTFHQSNDVHISLSNNNNDNMTLLLSLKKSVSAAITVTKAPITSTHVIAHYNSDLEMKACLIIQG